jgi:hypothetical protein
MSAVPLSTGDGEGRPGAIAQEKPSQGFRQSMPVVPHDPSASLTPG